MAEYRKLLRNSWKYFWDAQDYLCHTGKWSLDPIHHDLVEAVLAVLPADVYNVVRTQLTHRYFLSWQPSGLINTLFFYDLDSLPLIEDRQYEYKIFKVNLNIDSKKLKARVIFAGCRLFCIELSKPRKFYIRKSYVISDIRAGSVRDSIAVALDRIEHGRSDEIHP